LLLPWSLILASGTPVKIKLRVEIIEPDGFLSRANVIKPNSSTGSVTVRFLTEREALFLISMSEKSKPLTFPDGDQYLRTEFECNKNISVNSGKPDLLSATKKRGEKAP